MEKALRYELIKAIPELNKSIYPTNAPEGVSRPYLVYARISTNMLKTFEGYEGMQSLSYMFSIMNPRYEEMIVLRNQVENLLLSLPKTEIGAENIFIEDIDINNVTESYEFDLKVNRGIIDFTIYY